MATCISEVWRDMLSDDIPNSNSKNNFTNLFDAIISVITSKEFQNLKMKIARRVVMEFLPSCFN